MDEKCRYCLLSDGLISVRAPDGARRRLTLPEVLAALVQGEIISFGALQPHQRQAWFCFLVQLAAIALARAGREELPNESRDWKELLLALTDGEEAPWCLVVDDLSQPAFMQPPVPEGSLEEAGYRADVTTSDALDMLVTARNHDVKMSRVANPEPQHWLYALVTLQTQEGFMGRGNYGIIRMNSGYGNRPMVGMVASLDWPPRFCRDVSLVLSLQDHLASQYSYDTSGHTLLWLLPWDGARSSAIPVHHCHPLFIEVCRRVRFSHAEGDIRCRIANTKGPRLTAPDERQGVTGDPWTPVQTAEGKALTVGRRGFSYDLLRQILLREDFDPPPAMQWTGAESGGYLLATALARGQGKTEGLHRRVVPVPQNVLAWLSDPSRREELASRAQELVQTAADVQRQVLYPALVALLTAGHEGSVDADRVRRWTGAFDSGVDEAFFPELWASLDMAKQEARRRWQQLLKNLAEQQLQDAIASAPLPSIHRYRAVSAAQSIFHSRLREHLHALYPSKEEVDHEPVAGR
ncbi:MAG: type I-E CRISPR-associated protein Cse1/CasA [Candidatus Brocadiia bacterium]